MVRAAERDKRARTGRAPLAMQQTFR